MKKLITISTMILLMGFSLIAKADVNLKLLNKTGSPVAITVFYNEDGLPYQFWGSITGNLSVTKVLYGKNISVEDASAVIITSNSSTTSHYCNKAPGFIAKGASQVVFTVTQSQCTISNV
ncbi:MAG: hypothetical protein JSS53_08855 [Proteobacteria bacterium]|nr:hypothetical protein [Pseudomonadota bacterium]